MNQNETQKIIREILEILPLQTEEISFSCEDNDQVLWCQVRTKEPNLFIGRDGETLAALNHIARKLIEKYYFDKNPNIPRAENKIVIDVNGFQKKKIENLKTTAHMLSERAKFFKSNIETDPMTAHDRKIIHEFLAGQSEIQTESVGLGSDRRVVIKYSPIQ